MTGVVGVPFYAIFGLFAFYVSWTCTENLAKFGHFGECPLGTLIRIVYAVMAFLFWPLYLILYFFFFMGQCSSGYTNTMMQKPRRFSTKKIKIFKKKNI